MWLAEIESRRPIQSCARIYLHLLRYTIPQIVLDYDNDGSVAVQLPPALMPLLKAIRAYYSSSFRLIH
ncbi:hypothetical protein TMatcc_000494 [Talaromyces marneffei ATCC 18224]